MSQNKANYDYHPNLPAAIFFCVAFGVVGLGHIFQAHRGRALWMWPLICGVILEAFGYAFRYVAAQQLFTKWPLILSQVFLVVAPAFFAAQCYMNVGRMMSYVGAEHSIIRHSLITKLFVAFDVLSIFVQAASASSLSSNNVKVLKTGFRVLVAALAFQVIAFGFFVFVAIAFDVRSRRSLGEARKPLRHLFLAFYVSASLIIARSIYRTVEFASVKFTTHDAAGYVLTHEWPFYVFDSVLVFIAVIFWNIYHPARFLPSKKGLRIDGTMDASSGGCCGRRTKSNEKEQLSGPDSSFAMSTSGMAEGHAV